MTDDEQAIRAVVAKWLEASQAGDVETVLGLMTDDVVFLQPGRPPMIGKAAYAEQAKPQQGPPEKRMTIDGTSVIQEVQVAGDLAYLWSKLRVDVTPPGGETICRAGHTLTVFRKTGGKWLLARDANMLAKVE